MLPLSFPDAEVLILRRCIFEGSNPARWEGDRTKAAAALSDELKANIWGGRRQLVWPFAKTWVGGVAEGP